MTSTMQSEALTREQLATFDREGYLVVEDLFTDEDLQPVIDEIHGEVNLRARELVEQGQLAKTYAEHGFERQLACIGKETDKVAKSIWNGQLNGPAIFNLLRHPRLLDVGEQICGPELIASAVYRIRPKIPHYPFGEVPWHQDSGYTEAYCDRYLMLTVWLPLIDTSRENGCLWVIPRVHKGRVLTHATRAGKPYLIIPAEHLPAQEPVCVPVRKGGVLLLSNLTPHASFENSTDLVRWSMDLRYQSAALPTNAPITRLEGEAVYAPAAGVPLACYPPEADFLVRSRRRPNEVVTDPEVFHRIRQKHLGQPVSKRWGSG